MFSAHTKAKSQSFQIPPVWKASLKSSVFRRRIRRRRTVCPTSFPFNNLCCCPAEYFFTSANVIKLASKIIECWLQSVARFIALFDGQESWAMYYIKQEKKCNVAKRFTVSHLRSSHNCKIDSIHQTDNIVATRACAVATKTIYPTQSSDGSEDNMGTMSIPSRTLCLT